MGNTPSQSSTENVFEKELSTINNIVNNIVSEKDIFKHNEYNFLSQDVCNKHYVLLESELNKHLKVNLKGVGESLYLIPKESESKTINKREICQKISQHYMKILYILCLVKYVYNLEKNGDFSIAGIIMRNIRLVDNILEINFCNIPQKDYSKDIKDVYKLDFGKLEGLSFLTQYFLDKKESHTFLKVLKALFARKSRKGVRNALCQYIQGVRVPHIKELEHIYKEHYGEKLVCQRTTDAPVGNIDHRLSLMMFVDRDNPILSKEYCYEAHKIVIQTNTAHGKKVLEQYNILKRNYSENVNQLTSLLNQLVEKDRNNRYVLRDIDRSSLHNIINRVKDVIKTFFYQSLLDYHKLLDIGKKTPNINIHHK